MANICLYLVFICVTSTHGWSIDDADGHLPGDLIPSEYNLELHPHIYDSQGPPFHLQGRVEIKFLCRRATDQIVLHSRFQEIETSHLSAASGKKIMVTETIMDPANEFVILSVNNTLSPGEEYFVQLHFTGEISEDRHKRGVYVQNSAPGNETKYFLWAELTYSNARSVFPCFDEPEYKSTFNVVLLRHYHMTSLSNALLLYSDQRDDVWVADHFAETPLMSTYVVCFVIFDFPHVEATTSSGTLVRVWARPEVLEATEFALNTAVATQEWFEEYTERPDPMRKMDHVAIAHKGSAMENWGLITYTEEYLLWRDDWCDSSSKEIVATVMSHEIAHQWFGNLVTNEFWGDLWLNEGFASFFESLPLHDLHGWYSNQTQLVDHLCSMLKYDITEMPQPVHLEIASTLEYIPVTLSQYSKGALVLRMIQQVLTPETFKRGILKYVKRFSYSSVTSDDLWDVLTEQAAIDHITYNDQPLFIKDKFDPWLHQVGYPLIHVTWDPVLRTLNLTQQLYNPQNRVRSPTDYGYTWDIPLTLGDRTNSAVLHEGVDIWMDREYNSRTLRIGDPNVLIGDWILVNIGAPTLCRVKYDRQTFEHIVEQLKEEQEVIHPESRALLVDDTINLARYELIPALDVFKIFEYLGSEFEFLPWKQMKEGIDFPIVVLYQFPDTWKLFQQYLRSLVDPVYNVLGWEGPQGDIQDSLLRKLIVELACQLENEDCLQTALSKFQAWKIDPRAITVDQRYAVYCYGIRQGNEEDWQHLYGRYELIKPSDFSHDHEEKLVIHRALGCSADTALLRRSWLHNEFRSKYLYHFVSEMTLFPEGRAIAWELLKETHSKNIAVSDIRRVFQAMVTDDGILELEEFAGTRSSDKYIHKMVDKSRRWVAKNLRPIHDWLEVRIRN